MVPIFFNNKGELEDITPEMLTNKITTICKKHHDDKRAYAFAFILFDFLNPEISKVLEDFKYWKALDELSGKYISVFHINTREEVFAEDIMRFDGRVTKSLFNSGFSPSQLAKLKLFMNPEENIKLPCILFFQSDGQLINDYFVVPLKEETIENSFIEMKDFIQAAVDSLKSVQEKYRGNYSEIFNLVKSQVEGRKLKRNISKKLQSFPLNIFLGWIVGKV